MTELPLDDLFRAYRAKFRSQSEPGFDEGTLVSILFKLVSNETLDDLDLILREMRLPLIDHRRGDRQYFQQKGGELPFWFYEMQPFAYVIAGLLCWQLSQNQFVYPSALILMVVGTQVFVMRNSQRKHQSPDRTRASI